MENRNANSTPISHDLLSPACSISTACSVRPQKALLASGTSIHSSHCCEQGNTDKAHPHRAICSSEPYLDRQIYIAIYIYLYLYIYKILCIFKGANCSFLPLPLNQNQCPQQVAHVLRICPLQIFMILNMHLIYICTALYCNT